MKMIVKGDISRGISTGSLKRNKFLCSFCGSEVSMKSALEGVKNRRGVIRLEQFERFRMRFDDLYGKVRQNKITVYNYYRNYFILIREVNRDNLMNAPHSIATSITVYCPKCGRSYFFPIEVRSEIEPASPVTNDDLLELNLCSKGQLFKIANRMGWERFEDFQAWINGDDLNIAKETFTETIEKIKDLNLSNISRYLSGLQGVIKDLEKEERERKIMLLRAIEEQVKEDYKIPLTLR